MWSMFKTTTTKLAGITFSDAQENILKFDGRDIYLGRKEIIMKMTKKVRDQIVKEMEEIRQEIQDGEKYICMLSKEAPDFDDLFEELNNEISFFKKELEEIVLDQIRKYTNLRNPEDVFEIYGEPEIAFDMLYLSVREKSEEERKELYGFIKNMMEKFDLTCPPLEVFDDDTLQIWSDKCVKMFDVLESLNEYHYRLLDAAEEH